jgi:hypothetical protein
MKTTARLIISTALCFLNVTFSFGQQIIWQNSIGGSNLDGLRAVKQTYDGGFILGGLSASSISGDKTENNQDTTGLALSYDYWVVKVNSLGIIQWQNNIGGFCTDNFNNIIQTPDGGYLCGGAAKSPIGGDKSQSNRDASLITTDNWLLKLDATGNILWQKTYGGNNWEHITSI